jgi:hypothetical protein
VPVKTKSLRNIEEKLNDTEDPIRQRALYSAKSFKTSWIELGQALYTVWKDKLYKNWGYLSFDTYAQKEIGIRKQTALKLLKSYYFLEKEEPQYISKSYNEHAEPSKTPTFESVDALRLASSKKNIDREDYDRIKSYVLEKGKNAREVKKDITQMIRQREELEPDEARRKKKTAILKRLVSVLRSLKTEIELSKMLPAKHIKDINDLVNKVESEIDG